MLAFHLDMRKKLEKSHPLSLSSAQTFVAGWTDQEAEL
jgi:hypothetical protein